MAPLRPTLPATPARARRRGATGTAAARLRRGAPAPEPNPFADPLDPRWSERAAPHGAGTVPPAPGPLRLLLEARAPWEFAAMLAAWPWLARLPTGDGHPVLVLPGLGASDSSTAALRGFLRTVGYSAHPWGLGFNFGPRDGVLDACQALVEQLAHRHGQRVSLLGWSLGGVYAREIAKALPKRVRCVITLGSPFGGHPRATNAWRFFELVSGQSAHDPALLAALREPPPCPTTSIYSKTDGVVAWQCSLNPEGPRAENIEVHASHIGMGMNPLALFAIADRLRQDPRRWQRFDAAGAKRWFFKVAHQGPLAATAP